MSTPTEMKAARKRFHLTRWIALIAVLAISTTIGLLHQKVPGLRTVGVDALCPFGGVESLWRFVADGAFLRRIAWGSMILLIGAVATNLIFGRAFCGQFCPLGTLQELFGSLRDRLGIRRLEIPKPVDVPARFLKYAVFGVFTWLTWRLSELVIRPYDPWVAYHHLTSPELLTEFGIGAAILGVSIAGSFFYDRFFCKYLCPMGAFLGLFSRLGFYQVTRNEDACIDCGKCDTVCPSNIAVATAPGRLSDAECIACGLCVAECPAAGALAVEGRSKGVRITPLALTGATVAIMVGLVAVTTATGVMAFTKPSLATEIRTDAEGGAFISGEESHGAGQGEGQGAGQGEGQGQGAGATLEPSPELQPGQFDVSLIKGYMTMAEVSQATGIPAAEFKAAFAVTDAEYAAPLKDLKNTHDFDTQAVRDFVAAKLGVPSVSPESCQ